MNNEYTLSHHGILGQKWGVRRYQNYDGSYTKKGLERYNKSRQAYEESKTAYQQGTGNKRDVKLAKKQMNKDYSQLKRDYLADQGKELYRRGKRITGNETTLSIATAIAGGTAAVAKTLADNGEKELAKQTTALGVGLEVCTGILAAKNSYEAKRLRAYYAH